MSQYIIIDEQTPKEIKQMEKDSNLQSGYFDDVVVKNRPEIDSETLKA